MLAEIFYVFVLTRTTKSKLCKHPENCAKNVFNGITYFKGPVHTNPFSNENGAVLLQIRLSSTLQRRKRSPKMEPFENALQSGTIWKRCFLKTLFSSVDGENVAIWNGHVIKIDTTRRQTTRHEYPKWRTDATMTTMWLQFRANFAGRYIEMRMGQVHLSMRTGSIKAFLKWMRRCSVDGRKRYENDKCRRKSFWKRSKTPPFSFENGIVLTGLKSRNVAAEYDYACVITLHILLWRFFVRLSWLGHHELVSSPVILTKTFRRDITYFTVSTT